MPIIKKEWFFLEISDKYSNLSKNASYGKSEAIHIEKFDLKTFLVITYDPTYIFDIFVVWILT